MDERYRQFIWWLCNYHSICTYSHRVRSRRMMRIHTLDQAWDYWTKNIEMNKEFKKSNWYTYDNGSTKVTFWCAAIDGEYLFETENINGEGYSLLLCRPATDAEIFDQFKCRK